MKKILLTKTAINILKILISILLLYLVFKKIPFREITKIWYSVSVPYAMVGAVFFLISQILSAKRLEFYLNANGFSLDFIDNLKLYFLGMFYNFFIPGGIGGDAYKVYFLNRRFGWSRRKITGALFNDRLSGLWALGILILFFFLFLFEPRWRLLILPVIIAGIVLAFWITKKIFPVYVTIFFRTLLMSILIQLLQVLCFILLMKSIGISGNLIIYSVVFLGSSVLSLLSFAGIGVREILFLQASKYFDFNSSASVSAALLFTVVTAFFSLFGVFFMYTQKKE